MDSLPDGNADQTFTVYIRARDTYGNIAAFEQRSLTVHASGSSTFLNSGSSSAVVQFVNGVTSAQFKTIRPALVTVTLQDAPIATNMDVSSTRSFTVIHGSMQALNACSILFPHNFLDA